MTDAEISNAEKYRYERKFVVSDRTQLESIIRMHPAMFAESYPPRFVNNIYLDSFHLKNYLDATDGLSDRKKVRIRWYGHLFGNVRRPILEIKIKQGLIGRKELFPIEGFSMKKGFKPCIVVKILKRATIPDSLRLDLMSLEFVLLNRYRREYFVSADQNYRMTIDSEMQYYYLGSGRNYFMQQSIDFANTVLELKYSKRQEGSVEKITNRFPFRVSRNSKYVNGIERLGLW